MQKMPKPYLQEFLTFLINPYSALTDSQPIPWRHKLLLAIRATSLSLGMAFLLGFLTTLIARQIGFSANDNYIVVREITSLPVQFAFLLLVVIGPFVEELAFRLYLDPKIRSIIFGVLALYLFFIQLAISITQTKFIGEAITAVLIITLCVVAGMIWLARTKKKTSIETFFDNHLRFNVYASTLIFAMIHTGNYENAWNFWWFLPLLTLPQLAVGTSLAFVRLKIGFWWAVLTHSLYNFILGFTILSLMAYSPDLVTKVLDSPSESIIPSLTPAELSYFSIISFTSLVIYFIVSVVISQVILNFVRYRVNKA